MSNNIQKDWEYEKEKNIGNNEREEFLGENYGRIEIIVNPEKAEPFVVLDLNDIDDITVGILLRLAEMAVKTLKKEYKKQIKLSKNIVGISEKGE